MATFLNCPCVVVDDPLMGRCLSATRSFSPGSVIFLEVAMVYGSYDEDCEVYDEGLLNYLLLKENGDIEDLDAVIEVLSSYNKVQSGDIALCYLQTVAIIEMHMKNMDYSPAITEKYELFLKLTASNIDDCVTDIKAFRQIYPMIIKPDVFTDFEAGRILAILNTNQLELADLGGTGLFVYTAILEHNCSPNCSFSTNDKTLYLTAIKEIAVGDRLSIDYGNGYYHPTALRQLELQRTYGFTCTCEKCKSIDTTRAFYCEYCQITDAILYPPLPTTISNTDTTAFWVCTTCQLHVSGNRVQQLLDREVYLIESPPKTIKSLEAEIASRVLYPSHYLLYWSLHDICEQLTDEAQFTQSKKTYKQAYQLSKRRLFFLEQQLPVVHHERVIHLDKLGQLAVAVGDISSATGFFQQAYEMSKMACGAENPTTLALLVLASNTPVSLEDLQLHYARCGSG